MTEVTLIFHLTLKKLPENIKRGYIFAYSEGDIAVTAFVEGESIIFGIPKRDYLGIPDGNELVDFIKVPVELEKRIVVSFFCNQKDDSQILELYFGLEKIAEKTIEETNKHIAIGRLSCFCIGCSINKNNFCNFGYFDLYEMMSYFRLLNQNELEQIISYINKKPIKGYATYEGIQFSFSDKNGNFVQPYAVRQPLYKIVDK